MVLSSIGVEPSLIPTFSLEGRRGFKKLNFCPRLVYLKGVPLTGIEPISSASEAGTLSIEL